jgi:cytochrome c oxidase assembly protein subunit 15
MAFATLALMAVGSATRVMNAGLACPDWPLCYGQLVPQQQMNLQVFLEWFHRLDAALIGVSTLWLVGLCLWYRRQVPGWLPWAAVGALVLIGVQGALGGLTVTQLLRFDIVTAHLGTALLFFSGSYPGWGWGQRSSSTPSACWGGWWGRAGPPTSVWGCKNSAR